MLTQAVFLGKICVAEVVLSKLKLICEIFKGVFFQTKKIDCFEKNYMEIAFRFLLKGV